MKQTPGHDSVKTYIFTHAIEGSSIIQTYYEKHAPKLKDCTWIRQMADFTGQVIRPQMKAFLEKKGFFRQ